MREKLRNLFRNYAIVSIVLISLLLLGVAVNADYVKSSRTMRVVAAYGEQESRFSSNYLAHVNRFDMNPRTIHVSDSTDTNSVRTITICNHPQGSSSMPADSAITYNVKAYLTVFDSTTGAYRAATAADFDFSGDDIILTLKLESAGDNPFFNNDNDELLITESGMTIGAQMTLPALVATEHKLTVTINNAVQSCRHKLFLDVEAIPATQNEDPLRGRIELSVKAELTEATWSIAREVEGDTPISGYDGFNYIITGYGAPSGTFTLTWNSDKLTLNEAFRTFTLAKQAGTNATAVTTATTDDVHYSSFSFTVDSTVAPRYDVQFYPNGSVTELSDSDVTFVKVS